jgi:hypothetical protein
MRYPKDENLGMITMSNGEMYLRNFYGENEGRAVASGPIAVNQGGLREVHEVFAAPAKDAEEARVLLAGWARDFEQSLQQVGQPS